MNAWQIVAAGETVEAEIRALPSALQARYLRLLDLIERHGPHRLGMPHVRHLEGKLWELRIQGGDGAARVIYAVAPERCVLILHAYVKKTRKTPLRVLETARRRWRELSL